MLTSIAQPVLQRVTSQDAPTSFRSDCSDKSRTHQTVKAAVFNVKFSPNLGDGIIAECLEAELAKADHRLLLVPVDLAGRTEFSANNGSGRGAILKAIEHMPSGVRKVVVPLLLSALVRFRLSPAWRRSLESCDAAVIGGGALFTDTDRNFPIKMSGVLRICERKRIPVAISHVGVTPGWSSSSLSVLRSLSNRVKFISTSVRDPQSIEAWKAEFDEVLPQPRLAIDPGVLASDTYAFGKSVEGGTNRRPSVSLCITSPSVLRLHGDGSASEAGLLGWYLSAIEQLLESRAVTLFTNGSPEDEEFADAIFEGLQDMPNLHRAPRFITPSQLAEHISQSDLVIANRLHACIVAHSFGVPAIGLRWDRKLDSFFELIGRTQYVVDWHSTSSESLCALADRALADAPSHQEVDDLKQRCRDGIATLAGELVSAGVAA